MPTMTVIRVKYVEKNLVGEEPGIGTSAVAITNVNGNQKEVMINIDCPIGLIIDYVKKTAHLEGEIDLCEETTNQLKNVNSLSCWARGTEILVPGGVYFIVKIDRDHGGRISGVIPILCTVKSGKIASDIMSRIQTPLVKNKSTSQTGKISLEKIHGGKNYTTHREKRNKVGKPASRTREGQGR